MIEEQDEGMPEWYKEFERKENQFWDTTYPKLDWEGRVKYWIGSIHTMMRRNGESSNDEYRPFGKESYLEWKKSEPKIDKILGMLKDRLQDFDEAEMWRRIRS